MLLVSGSRRMRLRGLRCQTIFQPSLVAAMSNSSMAGGVARIAKIVSRCLEFVVGKLDDAGVCTGCQQGQQNESVSGHREVLHCRSRSSSVGGTAQSWRVAVLSGIVKIQWLLLADRMSEGGYSVAAQSVSVWCN